jgi:L-Ala-D/L-Glu epimerase
MKLTLAHRELHPCHAFRIARARRTAVRNVFIRVEREGIAGYGEASPNAFYGETAEGVLEKLESIADALAALQLNEVADLGRAWEVLQPRLLPSRAAQCALDLALWDWLGKAQGRSVAELAWGEAPRPVVSFGTIGLSTPEELSGKLAELRGFPRIKIKSDAAAELEPIRRVREESAALLAVDANCAWGAADLGSLAESLAELGVAFIEQPLAPEADRELRRERYALPLIADESSVTEQDVARVAEHFDGFNIKLVKCGGLTPALRMLRSGREAGCQVMVGCMLESSLLIAAGAVVAQRADYADLDGAWLLGDDPCGGWEFQDGVLRPPGGAGLGVTPAGGLFGE